jgi:hypothetical protein
VKVDETGGGSGVARSSRASAALGINRATAGRTEKSENRFLTAFLVRTTSLEAKATG